MRKRGLRHSDFARARSTKHHEPIAPTPRLNTELCMRFYRCTLKDLGMRIREKRIGGRRWKKYITTLRRVVLVPPGFDERSNKDQAVILGHELVHVRQARDMGWWKWFRRYLTDPRFRWSQEVAAYCESINILRALGADRSTLLGAAARYAEALAGYSLKRVSGYRKAARELMTEAIDG